tara:strand:+ start:1358 stop:1594 length:237 start_codon:yes stop_codon:yes gene_type:complete
MENKIIKVKRWLRLNGVVSPNKEKVTFNVADLEDILGEDILGRINERKETNGCIHKYDEVPYSKPITIFKCTKCGHVI